MAYEYTRVTQVFTVSSVPPCWVYPVSLLMQAYSAEMGIEELAVQPNFPDEETLSDGVTRDTFFTELV